MLELLAFTRQELLVGTAGLLAPLLEATWSSVPLSPSVPLHTVVPRPGMFLALAVQ